MSLNEALNWRYAAKRMNGRRVPEDKLQRILDAAHLAPSSFGLQPYTLLVVEDAALRRTLQAKAANQSQVAECSHLVVFAAWDSIEEAHVDDLLARMVELRHLERPSLEPYGQMVKGAVAKLSPEDRHHWAAKQAYIALGTLLTAAAVERVDASPMEGFDAEALDDLLELKQKNLRSVLLVALGYRDADHDRHAGLNKVRWPREKTVMFLDGPA